MHRECRQFVLSAWKFAVCSEESVYNISCTCTGICVLLTHLENCLQKVFQTFSTTIVTLKLNDLDKTASKISVSIRWLYDEPLK